MPRNDEVELVGGFRVGDRVLMDGPLTPLGVFMVTGEVAPMGPPGEPPMLVLAIERTAGYRSYRVPAPVRPEQVELVRRSGDDLVCPCCGKRTNDLYGRWPPLAIFPKYRVSPAACGSCASRHAIARKMLLGACESTLP